MDGHEQQSLGEIGRSVKRIEDTLSGLIDQVHSGLPPVIKLQVRMDQAEEDINHLGQKVDDVKTRSDRLIGGVGVLTFVLSLVPLPWRR